MPTSPPVTVILPAHNAEATILPAIASTLNQTYTDFELWVLENGSTDRTAEIARSFTDRRVKVFELGAVGFQGALQYGIENASSDWLARMDADDLMFPDRLKRQMGVIKQRPELMFVGTDFALLTPFGHVFERGLQDGSCEVDVARLGKGRFFADPSTIFNRRVALAVGGVDPEFTMGDVPLWFRMLTRGRGWEIAEPLYLYRIQPNSMSKGLDSFRQGIRVRAKYAPESVHLYREPQEDDVRTGWYNIAALEFLADENQTLRNAIEFLRLEAPRTAHRMGLLSRFGRYGRKLYQWRNPWLNSITRRPDWEQLFAPFIQRDTSKRNDDGTACYDLVSPLPE